MSNKWHTVSFYEFYDANLDINVKIILFVKHLLYAIFTYASIHLNLDISVDLFA